MYVYMYIESDNCPYKIYYYLFFAIFKKFKRMNNLGGLLVLGV